MNTIEYPDDNELKIILDFLYDNYKNLKIFFQKDGIEIVYAIDTKNNLTIALAFGYNNKKIVTSYFRYNKDSDEYKYIPVFCRIFIKYTYDFIVKYPKEATYGRI